MKVWPFEREKRSWRRAFVPFSLGRLPRRIAVKRYWPRVRALRFSNGNFRAVVGSAPAPPEDGLGISDGGWIRARFALRAVICWTRDDCCFRFVAPAGTHQNGDGVGQIFAAGRLCRYLTRTRSHEGIILGEGRSDRLCRYSRGVVPDSFSCRPPIAELRARSTSDPTMSCGNAPRRRAKLELQRAVSGVEPIQDERCQVCAVLLMVSDFLSINIPESTKPDRSIFAGVDRSCVVFDCNPP